MKNGLTSAELSDIALFLDKLGLLCDEYNVMFDPSCGIVDYQDRFVGYFRKETRLEDIETGEKKVYFVFDPGGC